ncbi:MAG: class I SAM-dependent methyltransferase [Christensenellaceae bacterium]|jgi:ubiquinone/menaquinone biosynthesis C-methylase UbiE|nr:class I SAM-dependent methyltransferase [Christensenellaceae bacterium]
MEQIKSHNLNWDHYAHGYSSDIESQMDDFHRNAWVKLFSEYMDKNLPLDILDVGTGPGFFPMILGEQGHRVTGIDFSASMLREAEKNTKKRAVSCTLLQMDAAQLSFSDASFDFVVCRNMAYSLAEPELAYSEWIRVLRQNGTLLVFDANWFHFLFDTEEKAKIDEFLEDYHAQVGKVHETYEKERELFFDHISIRPLSRVKRPDWDCSFLESLGANVTLDSTVGNRVHTSLEVYTHTPTPLFLIEAIKK